MSPNILTVQKTPIDEHDGGLENSLNGSESPWGVLLKGMQDSSLPKTTFFLSLTAGKDFVRFNTCWYATFVALDLRICRWYPRQGFPHHPWLFSVETTFEFLHLVPPCFLDRLPKHSNPWLTLAKYGRPRGDLFADVNFPVSLEIDPTLSREITEGGSDKSLPTGFANLVF